MNKLDLKRAAYHSMASVLQQHLDTGQENLQEIYSLDDEGLTYVSAMFQREIAEMRRKATLPDARKPRQKRKKKVVISKYVQNSFL